MKALKIISDLLPIPGYTVIIICFFFPFLTIKCNTTELVSVTGFDYVIGNDVKDKMEKSEMAKTIKEKMGKDLFDNKIENDSLSEDSEENASQEGEETGNLGKQTKDEKTAKILFFVILAVPLLMALSGLVISFTKSKRKGLFHIIFSTVGFIFLLSYGIMIKSSGDVNLLSSLGDGIGAGMISINLGNAYFVATIFFLIVILFFAMVKYLKKLYQEEQQIREESVEEFYSKEEF
ncbi:hypothetical protein [Flavobacterium macacae]|uniref:Uncharacterized protein n=1 Tax=Flavobacterium macacae TaxID=2488993 RepID=A0A3P3WAH5_9FLAO|nr:hypothetical protein [Flavobacterium macacae]RRJ92155.1 hypothetical protein EG849_06985 [Flavobacterium macacae]